MDFIVHGQCSEYDTRVFQVYFITGTKENRTGVVVRKDELVNKKESLSARIKDGNIIVEIAK